ncbi:peptidylprolyl isomerase [Aureispira anguillae]|uniref:Peptidylprolyl isomerase n=1 Tax=Aureispira anguillae TaxID=2864201 RepID=A0A915YFA4_9BACT|nr:peptidylprolyl isomerase [Aureispira anguillae]BDS11970.1 peptidylprolyl isomerase [Aureispira anguillae]
MPPTIKTIRKFSLIHSSIVSFFFVFLLISLKNDLIGQTQNLVGSVNGEPITFKQLEEYHKEFINKRITQENELYDTWDFLVSNALLRQSCNAIGIGVTPKEIEDLLFASEENARISPIVRLELGDARTGQIDRKRIKETAFYFANFDTYSKEEQQAQLANKKTWDRLLTKIKETRLRNKYFSLLESGLYTPKWVTKSSIAQNKTSFNFKYVFISYSPFDELPVSEQEIKNYLTKNAKRYQQPPTASLEFVRFHNLLSRSDYVVIPKRMNELAKEWKTAKSDRLFLSKNDLEIEDGFHKRSTIDAPPAIIDSIFGAKEGTIIGPYTHFDNSKITKVIQRVQLPDSVRARHILIPIPKDGDIVQVKRHLDSLRQLILDQKITFEAAALRYSQDETRTTGGDLGFVIQDGHFTKKLENYLFSPRPKEALDLILTPLGWHLIQITDRKFATKSEGVHIATITLPSLPSKKKSDALLARAKRFIQNNRTLNDFRKAAQQQNLSIGYAYDIAPNDYRVANLGANSSIAELIKWVHTEAKVGEVASKPYMTYNRWEVFHNDSTKVVKEFIVPVLVFLGEEGKANLMTPNNKLIVKYLLRHEKKKALVASQIKGLTLDEIAKLYNVPLNNAKSFNVKASEFINWRFGAPVGAVVAISKKGEPSNPIKGKDGLYIIELESKEPLNTQDSKNKKHFFYTNMMSNWYSNAKKRADIKDYRLEHLLIKQH